MDEYLFTKKLPALNVDAREIIRMVDEKPHLLARVTVKGMHFPQRALVPFMRITTGSRKTVPAWFTEINDEENGLIGYFPVDIPAKGTIEFGYGGQVMDRFQLPFDVRKLTRLDRRLVEKGAVEVTTKFLAAKMKLNA